MINHKKPELLAPAGNFEKLKIALQYGADAIYVSGQHFGLRALADNFTNEQLKEAVEYTHNLNKKIYVTINIFARNNDFEELIKFAKYLEHINVDAVIISDLGILNAVKQNTNLEIHVSTQANVLNKYTAEQYVNMGAKRIILARECSIEEIREITTHLKGRAEIEVFVHGAMCVSYSGRCMLSDYFIGSERSANRGACIQACRFNFFAVEQKRPNEIIEFQHDQNGTYIMNSRDLCLINHLDELINAGVTSIKIEGRTKTQYYVANVVNAYRRKLDNIGLNTTNASLDYLIELQKINHRPYTTGFIFGDNKIHYPTVLTQCNSLDSNPKDTKSTKKPCYKDSHIYSTSADQQTTHKFIALVTNKHKKISQNNFAVTIEQRNLFTVGDELETLSPDEHHNKTFTVTSITNQNGESITRAQRVQDIITLDCPYPLTPGTILRKKL